MELKRITILCGFVLFCIAPISQCLDLSTILGGGKSKKPEVEPVSDDKAKNYLEQFGYVAPSASLSSGSGLSADLSDVKQTFKSAIRKFQEFAGLNPTGELDIRTKKKMAEPRCGVYDVQAITSGRDAAFKWRKNQLTYSILSFSNDLPRSDINRAIRKAFDTWSAVTPLEFTEVSADDDSADIKVKFASGSHGDPWPFDGRGGVLAHATMPTSGMLHFDESENWVYMDAEKIASYRYTDLLPVAIHESGHTLGLTHSRTEDSIMAPFYQETVDSSGRYVMPVLKSADISAIQDIYGPRRGGGSSRGGSGSSRGGSWGDSGFGSGSSRGGSRGGGTDWDDFPSSGRGSGSGWGGHHSRGDSDDSNSGWTTTTERTTTKHHHRGFFSSLWSKWMGTDSSPRTRARESGWPSSWDSQMGGGDSSSRDTRSLGDSCLKTIDAVANGPDDSKYFFEASKVYEVKGKAMTKTHSLRLLFSKGPVYVEAAFYNPKTQTMLLFQSNNVYAFLYDQPQNKFVLNGDFPKKLAEFNPVGGLYWIDGHQFLFSKSDSFAVYDEYWNKANTVNKISAQFSGFPKAIKGGFVEEGNVMALFTTTQVYHYDAAKKKSVGEPQSVSSYLGC